MNYAKAILGKELSELTYEDVERYFEFGKEESDQIEFKAYVEGGALESKISGVVRTIAAFLNSDGGLLIWGAPKGEKEKLGDRVIKIFKGSLSPLPLELLDKDWLVGKITDKIVPLPVGIRMRLIRKEQLAIALLEVDKSLYSPHQAEEKYFMRLDGQTRTAPHHYVEALFNKISYPQLEAYIKVKNISRGYDNYFISASLYFANKSFQNSEVFNVTAQIFGGVFGNHGHSLEYTHPRPLYYGEWVPYGFSAVLDDNSLAPYEGIATILVHFGDRVAPRKICHYSIDFNHINFNSDDPQENIVIEVENKLQSEIMVEKNVSDNERLKSLGVLRNFKK